MDRDRIKTERYRKISVKKAHNYRRGGKASLVVGSIYVVSDGENYALSSKKSVGTARLLPKRPVRILWNSFRIL